jgi:hypothetical protein
MDSLRQNERGYRRYIKDWIAGHAEFRKQMFRRAEPAGTVA